MKHFSDERWLDFARRLLPPEEESEMRAHLEDGCRKCAELCELWQTVYQIVSREADYQPDDSIVRTVKHSYDASPWRQVAPQPDIRFANLVFDSFTTAGALVGVRSISPAARHLLYRLGPLAIDVRLDAFSGSLISIAGQILGASGDAPLAGREVSVTRGDATIAQTATNEFGEFQVEVDSGPGVRVRVAVDSSQAVVLPLPD